MTTIEPEKEYPPLTRQQMKSVYKYFELVADRLNSTNHLMVIQVGNQPIMRVKWDKDSIKKYIWKPLQNALLESDSIADLDRVGPSEIYDHMNNFISTEFGEYVPFPDRFTQAEEMGERR